MAAKSPAPRPEAEKPTKEGAAPRPEAEKAAEETIAQRRAKDGVLLSRKKKEAPASPLTESLDEMREEDFKIRPKRKKTSRGFTVTQWLVLFLCVFVFAFSAYKFAGQLLEYAEARKQYDSLREIFYSDSSSSDYLVEPPPAVSTPDLLSSMQTSAADIEQSGTLAELGEEESYQVILARLAKLKKLNEDTYGWLKVSGTDVDYPVVQGADNDYYLRRSFYKSYLNSGSIFVDAVCGAPSENRNTVIYGHNMKDGTMFHSLHNLNNQTYFENAEIRLMTTEGVYVYEVYSVHQPHEMDRFFFTEFTDATWQEFLSWTQAQSFFPNSDIPLSESDKIITLSTCVSTTQEEAYRFVVHGVLREIVRS